MNEVFPNWSSSLSGKYPWEVIHMRGKPKSAAMPEEVRLPARALYWCGTCRTPVVITEEQAAACPGCGDSVTYLATDLRPVFARERRILQFYHGLHLTDVPVWRASISRLYFVDGQKLTLPEQEQLSKDIDAIAEYIRDSDHYDALDKVLLQQYRSSLQANRLYLKHLETNAFDFIQRVVTTPKFRRRKLLVSFSGGKDSTVVSHLVVRALGPAAAMHVFSDTTLEDPNTYQYIEEFRAANPHVEFYVSKVDHNFDDLVEHMGVAAHAVWHRAAHIERP